MAAAEPVRVDPEEVHRSLTGGESVVLVCAYDEEDKARAFRLEGALTLGELQARLNGLERDCDLVFYSATEDDADAIARAKEWMGQGFRSVKVLAGGVDAWKAAGFPMAQPAHREELDHTPELAPLGPKPTVPEGEQPLPPRQGIAGAWTSGTTSVAEGQTAARGADLKARDFMTQSPEVIMSDSSVEEAARRMRDLGIGALPVCDAQRKFVGMITDRDITVRVTAEGKPPAKVSVADAMSPDLVFTDEEASVEQLARLMQERGVRRVPILRKAQSQAPSPGDIVGIVSLDDLATDLRVSDLVARTLARAAGD